MSAKVDAYLDTLPDWQQATARELRAAFLAQGLSEDFKWGHPMWSSADGPVCLLKGFKAHMNLAFWRGAQMGDLDARLEPSGSFQMATIKLTCEGQASADDAARLAQAGAALNKAHGDPMKAKA
jgi:hypothetical protein